MLDHMVNVHIVLKENAILFQSVTITFCIPISSVSVIQFLCIITRIWCYYGTIVYFSHSDVVLIYISVIASNGEHLCMCMLVTCIFPSMKYLFMSFAHFLIESFDISFFISSSIWCAKIYSKSIVCLFYILSTWSFMEKNVFNFDEVQFVNFPFHVSCFRC